MRLDKRQLRKIFPNLAKELNENNTGIPIASIISNINTAKKAKSDKFRGHYPDIIDFLRRCDNDEQAKKIISHLECRNEISREQADNLRMQLIEKGLRSFGSKKETNYYFKQAGY